MTTSLWSDGLGLKSKDFQLWRDQVCLQQLTEAERPAHFPFRIGLALCGEKISSYWVTWNATLLFSVPTGVVTSTIPVVAPAGTMVLISALDTTLNVAAVPLKLTLVAPVRLVPRIITFAPSFPEAGFVDTNGPRPVDRLKIVPLPLEPPAIVVP